MDTLDDFSAREQMADLTLVKVDTEGHDLSIIAGARGLLERGAIAVMQFEYDQRWIASRTYLRDVFEAAPRRCRIGKITRSTVESVNGRLLRIADTSKTGLRGNAPSARNGLHDLRPRRLRDGASG